MSAMMPEITAQGYAPPSVRQFSIFLANRPGKLLEVVELFDESPTVQLCGFSVVEASDHAVLRIIPNCSDAAAALLREHRLPFSEMDLLVVETVEGHNLARLCLYLLGAELNIRFAYPMIHEANGQPAIALAVDDFYLAGQILRKKGFRLLGEAELPRPGEG